MVEDDDRKIVSVELVNGTQKRSDRPRRVRKPMEKRGELQPPDHHEQLSVIESAEELPKFWSQQLSTKLSSYRHQDIAKGRYDPDRFISLAETIELLRECKMQCQFCLYPVFVIYSAVCDSRQWTLDRTDNEQGHNAGNVEIACLQCNLKRRDKTHRVFMEARRMRIIKTT